MQHTPDQARIISAPVGNLLVSAAAGSGKTSVMTDRIVRRIIEGELDVRQVLVMTFTEAAARSMKEKIEKKLQASLSAGLDKIKHQWVSRQLSLLPSAAISTIHAFCLDVIRNFYYCVRDEQGQPRIEPGFGIADGVESDLVLRQSLDEVMASQYERIDASEGLTESERDEAWENAFYRLVEGYGDRLGDQPVRELILGLHRFLRSLPGYERFVAARLSELEEAAADFSGSRYARELLRMLKLRLDRAASQFDEMQGLLDGGIRFYVKIDRNQICSGQFGLLLQTLRQLDAYLESGGHDWDHIREMAGCLTELDLPQSRKTDSPEKQTFLRILNEYVAEVIHFLTGLCGTPKYTAYFIFDSSYIFNLPAAEISADIRDMLPAIRVLFDLVLQLDRQYSEHKRTAGMIDFSDFEHLALAILQTDEARQYYRQHFKEVYVDEYQDTSSIQEEIIRAVSLDNCLMVGDVKQSIYRFRHARPKIFLEKYSAYKTGDNGALHELNMNFRSVDGILKAANDLFYQLMSRGAGEIEYDENHALQTHRQNHPEHPVPVHLSLLNRLPAGGENVENADDTDNSVDFENDSDPVEDSPDDINTDELTRDEQEALLAVSQMKRLHEKGYSWQDMVVLTRTRTIGQAYQTQLESFGIPTLIDTADSFLDTPVLRQLESLIHLLDNLRQDIPLAAIMRSDLFQGGFSDEELTRIRLQVKQDLPACKFFHEAVLHYASQGTDRLLRDRVSDFLTWLDKLRDREQYLSIGELIGLIFAETGWLDRLAARPDGERLVRQARQFQQWAEQFEGRRQRGLYAFARYLESLRSRGPVESPFSAETVEQDAVRIMTIHRSKGLEFPVVFLAGTGYALKPKDSKDHLMLSENLGIGMDYADPEIPIRYPSHLKLAMLEEVKAASLAEELRLLYVAITRAMDQLYIVGSVRLKPETGDRRLQQLVRQAAACPNRQLPDYLVLSGQTFLDWILLALARQPGLDWSWLESGVLPEDAMCTAETADSAWDLRFYQLEKLQAELESKAAVTPGQKPDAAGTILPVVDPACLIGAVLDEPAACRETDLLFQQTWQRVAAPYRHDQAARTPVKLSVSELKRREQPLDSTMPDEASGVPLDGLPKDPRGIGLVLSESITETLAETGTESLNAASLGTLLHAVFRYLDISAACQMPDLAEIDRQLDAMRIAGMFTDAEIAAIKPMAPAFLSFARSDLAREMSDAIADPRKPIHQEMPFTLALPACQVYSTCGGLAPEDRVLVQGIIDCWYETEEGVTLIDYKSDRLTSDRVSCLAELRSRYSTQLDYYARAIQAATGKTVTRRLIWMIRQGRAYDLGSRGDT